MAQNSSATFSPSLSNLSDASDRILRATIDTLAGLKLDSIDESWVEDIWRSQFTDCQELEEDFEAQHTIEGTSVPKLLEKATEFAQKWLNFVKKEDLQQSSLHSQSGHLENSVSMSSNSSFWSNLIQNGIRYKALIALLFYYMETGQKFEATSRMRNYCLKSTSLYFVLLGVPGSGAFKIFHPVLYNKALDTFKMAMKLHLVKSSPKKKSKKGPSSKSQGQGSQVPRSRHLSRAGSTCSGISDMMDWDDSDDDDGLTPAEVNELTSGLNRSLYSFLTMLDHCPLKRSPESLEQTIAELVELTHLETGFANLDFTQRLKRSDLSSLAYNAYVGLQRLCTPLHGQVSNVTKLILQHVLPGILMTHRGSSDISPKGLAVIREHALHFIKHLMVTVSDDAYDAVEILIHHLAMKVPDKAEYRHRASAAINILMMGLPNRHFSNIVKWFFRLAHIEKSANRQFAIEVMGQLLVQNERENPSEQGVQGLDHDYGGLIQKPTENGIDQHEHNEENVQNGDVDDDDTDELSNKKPQDAGLFSSHKFLFGVIFSRCKDNSALVRAKALQTLADVTSRAGDNDVVADIISNLFEDDASVDRNEKRTVDFLELLQDPEADLSNVNPLPKSDELVEFLRKRALDDSVYVRKNALLVLENILRYYSSKTQELEPLALDLVGILTEHCRDPSLMVRKQIVGSMTEIVKAYPDHQVVINKFVEGVFPLILDVEQKAAEKVQECIWEVLFGNIVSFDKAVHTRHFLPWKILNATEKLKMTSYLSRACSQWAKDKMLKPSLLTMLRTHIDTENSNSAWLLLALVTGHLPLQDPHYVMEYFNNSIHTPEGVGLYTLLQVLRVLLASVSQLDAQDRKSLQKDLVALVKRFLIPPELISTAIDIATLVSWLESGGSKGNVPTPKKIASTSSSEVNLDGVVNLKVYHSQLDEWAHDIIKMIDDELGNRILQFDDKSSNVEDTRMTRQIFTLGELAQICPHNINKRLFLLMQGIIFQQGSATKKTKSRQQLPSSQTQSNDPVQVAFTPTTKLQALSVITLTKMCLQNEDMAKRVVPAFGRLLDTTNDIALKNNIMYSLSDMCIRFASLVDPLIPQMTACLKDENLIVRRTTLTTLIHLLQEDYLKMTSSFFFRILQTLCDVTDEIKDLTTFYIQQRLLKRKPRIMFQNLIESIFHFNDYTTHDTYNKMKVSEHERKLFALSGKKNKEDRMKLYKFMLEHMSDEHRFETTHKLCKDILNGCVEGSVKLNSNNAKELLQDTLAVLASDEIKLASLKSKQEGLEEEPVDDPHAEMAGMLVAAAKKKIISQVVKKNVIENIIPIVIALKHKLEKLRSPLLDDLMTYLREVMKDYKNEVKEILAADKQLATEIQFDLKKWEEEMEARKSREEEEDISGDHTESPGQEQLLRNVLLDAIRNNKKSTSDQEGGQDPKEKQKEVINNLIELSLPKQKDVEMSGTEAEKSNEERQIAEAVANLTPQVVLNRLKDGEAQKLANVESEDQRLCEAQISPRTHQDIDSHQKQNIDEAETPQETPQEVNLEEALEEAIASQNDEVLEEIQAEKDDDNPDTIEVETEVDGEESDDANDDTVIEKPTKGKRGRPLANENKANVEDKDENATTKKSKRGRPKKSSEEDTEKQEKESESDEVSKPLEEEDDTENVPEKSSKRGRKPKEAADMATESVPVPEKRVEEPLEEEPQEVQKEQLDNDVPKTVSKKSSKRGRPKKSSEEDTEKEEKESESDEVSKPLEEEINTEIEPTSNKDPEIVPKKSSKSRGRKPKKTSEIDTLSHKKQTESVPEKTVIEEPLEEETELDNDNVPKKSSKRGRKPKEALEMATESVPEKTVEEEPQEVQNEQLDIDVSKTVTKKSSKRGRPKKSANEEEESEELAVNTQEEETTEKEAETTVKAKVQSKESRGKSPSNNDDSAWEDLPNENVPAVVEPIPKSIKRVKKSAINKLRAISTPNKNESHLQANVTFMDRSEADISAIPVLSPPTVKKNTRIKPAIKPANEASFQFRSKRGRGSEDNFDALVQEPKRSKASANEQDVGNTTTRSGRSTKKNPKYK